MLVEGTLGFLLGTHLLLKHCLVLSVHGFAVLQSGAVTTGAKSYILNIYIGARHNI